jgi:hypothetical protein
LPLKVGAAFRQQVDKKSNTAHTLKTVAKIIPLPNKPKVHKEEVKTSLYETPKPNM